MKTVIEMAREAGFEAKRGWGLRDSAPEDVFAASVKITREIEAFAALVRAEEREACAKVCDRVVEGKDPDDIHSDSQWAALTLAAEIRARSNT
jgi:transposase